MKTELRKKYKLLRKKITFEKREAYSKAIFNIIESEFDIKNKNVSVFLPIEKFNEINTWHLIDNINANFFLPVVKSKDLIHIKYKNKTQLKTSDWGIDEPLFGEETIPSNFVFDDLKSNEYHSNILDIFIFFSFIMFDDKSLMNIFVILVKSASNVLASQALFINLGQETAPQLIAK